MKVHVEFRLEWMGYAVYLYREVDGQRWFKQPDGSELCVKNYAIVPDLKPTFILEYGVEKELIEALQRVGVQPKQLTKIEGQYEAQGKHLNDLQNILRKKGIL